MAGWAVFLSYVEATHDAETKALKAALEAAGIPTFRFKEDVPSGEPFGPVLADALLGSRVVVTFLDSTFLERPNCRWELNAVLAAGDLEAKLVLARPVSDSIPNGLAGVPPAIANRRWPRAHETADLVALVQERITANPPTLAEALGESSASQLRLRMLETNLLPPPDLLTHIPHAPDPLPGSIDEAFVGRSEMLWRLDHALRLRHGLGTRVRSTVALEGGGGTGKTRLAREYVRRYGSHYRGGIYWIDATGRLDEQLHSVLRVLDTRVPDLVELRKNEVVIAGYLRGTFEGHRPTEPVLWVVDGVPEASLRKRRPKRAPSLGSWCPLLGDVALLVTSRVMVSTVSPSIDRIPIDVLPATDAEALLKRGVDGAGLPHERAGAIADWVGRLPLALTLLNAALRAGTIAPAELARRAGTRDAATPFLDAVMEVLRNAGLADLEPGALRGVSEAFAISYDLLDDEAQMVLRMLAQLSSDPVPEAFLDALGPTVATPAARTALRLRSFVEPSPGQEIPAFGQVHVLLADFVRTVHRVSDDEFRLVIQAMLTLFDQAVLNSPASWQLLNALLPQGMALCERIDGTDTSGDAESALELELRMASVLDAQGSYAKARPLEQRVLEARARLLGPEHPDTLKATGNLAITLYSQGDYPAARKLDEQVLEARTRLLGPEHPDTLKATNNLAVTLHAQGDYPAARTLQEQVLEARVRILGPDNPDSLSAANNLADTLGAQGEYQAARVLQEHVLDARRRVLGPEHPASLTAANNLANTLYVQGDYPAARQLEERVLEASTRLLGPEHPDTLMVATNLANTLASEGDHPAALALRERVLEAFTRLLGPEHPASLKAATNLANTPPREGDHPAALARRERVLEAFTRLLGPEHPDTLAATVNVAWELRAQGDYPAALRLEEQMLASFRRVLGPEHPDTLSSANNLALTLYAQGDYPAARTLQERVLEARKRVLGPEHHKTLITAATLGKILRAQGDYPAARTIQERVLEARTRLLGPEHPDTLSAAGRLGDTLRAQGDYPAARTLWEQVLEARTRLLGPEDPTTLSSASNLALTLHAQGDYPAARTLWEQVLEARTRLLGPEDPTTLSSASNLALTLHAQGDYSAARTLWEQVLEAQTRSFGPEDPDTLSVTNNLAATLYSEGDYPAARTLQERVLEVRKRVLGPEDPTTLSSASNLALTLYAQGDYPAARAVREQVLEARKRLLRLGHSDTPTVPDLLAGIQRAEADESDEAVERAPGKSHDQRDLP